MRRNCVGKRTGGEETAAVERVDQIERRDAEERLIVRVVQREVRAPQRARRAGRVAHRDREHDHLEIRRIGIELGALRIETDFVVGPVRIRPFEHQMNRRVSAARVLAERHRRRLTRGERRPCADRIEQLHAAVPPAARRADRRPRRMRIETKHDVAGLGDPAVSRGRGEDRHGTLVLDHL
jgi:hypothetical protein